MEKNIAEMFHRIIQTLQRMNRDGMVDEDEFALLHKDVEMIFETMRYTPVPPLPDKE